MTRPQPGDMVRRYLCLWRLDVNAGPRGWWLTIWRTRPPRPGQAYIRAQERWYGQHLRVILSHEVLP